MLPASLAGDTDRLARFQREAEVLAALNHPSIAAIYGLEKTPFGRAGSWSYVGGQKPFNLAGGMPSELLDRLAADESSSAALSTPAVRVLTDLRNALAHGGIA